MTTPHLDRPTADRVSLALVRLVKLLKSMRQHAPRVHPAVDSTAYPILFTLATEPHRVSVLAERVHSDVSTVSRQVSALVAHGLLEKVSDPDDGRAQVVRLADEGHALVERIRRDRNEWFRTLLDDWAPEDARTFATHLERFGDALESSRELQLRRRHTADEPVPNPHSDVTATSDSTLRH
jgi:DNA-binding MarR family transcriptional regulator